MNRWLIKHTGKPQCLVCVCVHRCKLRFECLPQACSVCLWPCMWTRVISPPHIFSFFLFLFFFFFFLRHAVFPAQQKKQKNGGGKTLLVQRGWGILLFVLEFCVWPVAGGNRKQGCHGDGWRGSKNISCDWSPTLLCNKIQRQVHVLPDRERGESLGNVEIDGTVSSQKQRRLTSAVRWINPTPSSFALMNSLNNSFSFSVCI